ncbi:MAG: Phosphate transport ATP-binding protein PstB, partial [uncultured Pseudonocardia sp.]
GQEHRGPRPQHLLRILPRGGGRPHDDPAGPGDRADRAVRVRQVHVPALDQPYARGDPGRLRPGQPGAGRHRPVRPRHRPGDRPPPGGHGLPAAQPLPHDVDLRQRDRRAEAEQQEGEQVGHRRAGREVPARGEPVERGQGPPRQARGRPVRRAAAAPVHRPGHRGAARRAAHGRAVLGARPDLHARDRGPDQRAQAGLHDRHRHPQHAAGRPGERLHRVLQHRGHRQARQAGGDGRDQDDLLLAEAEGHRGLRLGPLRL